MNKEDTKNPEPEKTIKSVTVLHAMIVDLIDQADLGEDQAIYVVSGKVNGRCQSYGTGSPAALVAARASLAVNDPNTYKLEDQTWNEIQTRMKQLNKKEQMSTMENQQPENGTDPVRTEPLHTDPPKK